MEADRNLTIGNGHCGTLMPLSNAERQRRWRERLKAKASANQAMAPSRSLVVVLVEFYPTYIEGFEEGELILPPSAFVADKVWDFIATTFEGIDWRCLSPELVTFLGGQRYVEAVEAWNAANRERRRKHAKCVAALSSAPELSHAFSPSSQRSPKPRSAASCRRRSAPSAKRRTSARSASRSPRPVGVQVDVASGRNARLKRAPQLKGACLA